MAESAGSRRAWALDELKRFGIRGAYVYLIDLIPLIEMIWADGKAQPAELEHLTDFLRKHVDHVNRLAEQEILTFESAFQFLAGYLEERPDPDLMKTLRSFVTPVRLSNSDPEVNDELRRCLLSTCIDIAASSVSHYPFESGARFDCAEKSAYFEIVETV